MTQTAETGLAAVAGQTGLPAPKRRLGYIDGLRALACLAVFAHHCWMNTGEPQWRLPLPHGHAFNVLRLCQFGNTGVHLFLLLSGYCLFLSYARPGGWERFEVAAFARQRAWRILPAYYAACVFCLALTLALPTLGRVTGHGYTVPAFLGPLSLALHAALLHGFYAPALYDINGVFWSLSLEWQFYFTFPLLAWSFHRKGPWITVAAVAAVNVVYRIIVARYFLSADTTANWAWCSAFAGRWLEFALGMLAAWQSARCGEAPQSRIIAPALAVTAVICALLGSNAVAFSPLSDIEWGVCYYCLLRAVTLPGSALQTLFAAPALVWIGTISYSIYLLHMPILGLIAPLTRHGDAGGGSILWVAALGMAIVLPLARVFYGRFEQPFLRRRA